MGLYDNQRWAVLWTGKALTYHRDSMCHDCALVLVTCPAESTDALGGAEQRQLPASFYPAQSAVPCPRPQRATETRHRWLVVPYGSKAVLTSVSSDLFLCCFSWLYLSLLLKTASKADAVTTDASLHVSLPLPFSSCLFPSCHFCCYSDLWKKAGIL